LPVIYPQFVLIFNYTETVLIYNHIDSD